MGGNGQTELAEILMGVLPGRSRAHRTRRQAATLPRGGPEKRRARGLASIPADRQTYGLAGGLSVADNYAVGGVVAGHFGSLAAGRCAAHRAATREAVRAFDVQGVRSSRQKAALLSGGNAQKLVIAREFAGAAARGPGAQSEPRPRRARRGCRARAAARRARTPARAFC